MSLRVWPDVAIAPGEALADEIEARGLSQAELARRMGRPVQVVNEIVRGKKAITAETALGLEDVLGVAAHFWLRLEADHQLTVARLARRRGGPRAPRLTDAQAERLWAQLAAERGDGSSVVKDSPEKAVAVLSSLPRRAVAARTRVHRSRRSTRRPR
jgi:addiction module HigA family antidote